MAFFYLPYGGPMPGKGKHTMKDENGTETATGTEQTEVVTTEQTAAEQTATGTATEQAGEQTEAQKDEARKAEEVRKSKEGTPDPVQKKIDKEVGRRKAAEAEAARAREEAAYLKGRLEAGKGGGEPQDETFPETRPKPTAEQFDDNASFVEALTDWKLEQREAKAAAETARRTEGSRVAEIIKTGVKKYEDFEEKVLNNPNLPITREMKQTIDESEQAADILHHLGSNPDEAARISKLSPLRQAVEIGKLEVKLSTAAAPAPPVKKVPPAPPATVGGTGSTIPDESKMSDEQWHAEEKKRIAEAKRTGKR